MSKYTHLGLPERELIFLYLNQGKTIRKIGRLLGRDHKTISREIARNRKDGNEVGSQLGYTPSTAHEQATLRRQEAKVGNRKLDDPAVKRYVVRKLGKGCN